GERGPRRCAASGAPGGAAPLRHWGARALARRAADPRKVRQGCLASAPAPPGAPFPLRAREKEKGERATPGARKSKSPGRVALATRLPPDLIRGSAGRAHVRRSPPSGRRRIAV